VPADVKTIVDAKISEFKAGKTQVFTGPIRDNKGSIKIPAGEVGDPNLRNTINWFVEGVIAQAGS
jgi:simple sugar transport system substrate-binding protein